MEKTLLIAVLELNELIKDYLIHSVHNQNINHINTTEVTQLTTTQHYYAGPITYE